MNSVSLLADGPVPPDGPWVDNVLLAGPDDECCLVLDQPITRATLRNLVTERQTHLHAAGLRAGGTVALCLPPSLTGITTMLAAWRAGAQVTLLDHRLAAAEISQALSRLTPQFLVRPTTPVAGVFRGFYEVESDVVAQPGGLPAATPHVLYQLSSGSTGPSKIIGRTAASLVAEVRRYARLDDFPRPGERVVLLGSIVHVLGLVGGLLYALAARVRLVIPARVKADAVLAAITAEDLPTTVIGVPFHAEMLASVQNPGATPRFHRMITAGELVRGGLRDAFRERYPATLLGNMYGMTEVGVIATDLSGRHTPAVSPAPGMEVSVVAGQVLVRTETSPYVGPVDPSRWVDGWLRTRDAGTFDAATGLLTINGRLDSQVSIGGLKVDLAEVEAVLAGLPGVTSAIVLYDKIIMAYVTVAGGRTAEEIQADLGERLAAYKRPRSLRVLGDLPRTATGKIVRDPAALRSVARDAAVR
ncbi:class I adenylate-forming enzyme family protein [Micromonospora sp. NPDC049101]|uniref:class I adenylate-forming enzyme family protein n=1 Tax=unclassified Micromonospora TaxID=2617518 RepID=UPI003401983B